MTRHGARKQVQRWILINRARKDQQAFESLYIVLHENCFSLSPRPWGWSSDLTWSSIVISADSSLFVVLVVLSLSPSRARAAHNSCWRRSRSRRGILMWACKCQTKVGYDRRPVSKQWAAPCCNSSGSIGSCNAKPLSRSQVLPSICKAGSDCARGMCSQVEIRELVTSVATNRKLSERRPTKAARCAIWKQTASEALSPSESHFDRVIEGAATISLSPSIRLQMSEQGRPCIIPSGRQGYTSNSRKEWSQSDRRNHFHSALAHLLNLRLNLRMLYS